MRDLRPVSRLLALAALAAAPAAAQPACDPALLGSPGSPLSYRLRGDRCEGIYAQQVSALTLEVRSLVAGFAPFDPAVDGELVLAWKGPPGAAGEVRVRAFSLRPRTYFRMDTAVPPGRAAYRWPGDVLAALKLGREELGVVAWTDRPGPAGAPEVYLPLRVATAAAQPPETAAEYLVTVVPSKRAREVRLTVTRLDAGGGGVDLRRAEELGYGYYPSNQPTVFSTGPLGAAGLYRVQVAALAVDPGDEPAGLTFDLYHPGD